MKELCLDKKRYPDRGFCRLWKKSVVCGVKVELLKRGRYNKSARKTKK